MGCYSSTQNVHEIHDQNKQKKYIKSGYSQNIRTQLLQAIEWNDPMDYATTTLEKKIPINAQLSESGLFWLAHHYCCRWNAYKVLDYILKTAYLENASLYAQLVNIKTYEGLSCLHLCAIWNSPQCLKLLLKFGGLNLQIKDKTQTTPYQNSISYKNKNIQTILKQYEDNNIHFLALQNQKLMSQQLLSFGKVEDNDKPAKVLNNVFGNLFQQNQKQAELLKQKQMIEQQREKIRAEIKKLEELQAKKQKQRLSKLEQQKIKKAKRQVQENQKKLLEQLQKKEKELANKKNQLIAAQKEKEKAIIEQQKKKVQQFYKANQIQLATKKQNAKIIIESKKEQVQKAREQRVIQITARIENKSKPSQSVGQIPPQLLQKYENAKRVGIFTDPDFPQNQASIGDATKAKKFINQLAWLRPKQIFKQDYQLFDGIDSSDIKQGSLGVCYMLATLATLAQYPDRIKSLFPFYDKSLGFYVVKLLIHGQIKYIAIDDAVPCSKTTKSPLFAKPNGNQIWVCLVEKAWCKCIGSYTKAQSMSPNHLMQDLTTCPSFGAWFKDKTQKTKDIDTYIKNQNIIVLTSASTKKIQGIVNNHAYSLLNVYQHEGKNIYKIRNPWGKFQWNGQYNDKSPFWTAQLNKKLNHVDADDGIFFLSQSQLLEAFEYYSICLTRTKNQYSYTSLKSKKGQSKYFTFELDQDDEINLRFVQKFNRMLNDQAYKYSPVIFQVAKIQTTGQVTFMTEGDNNCFWGGKSVHSDQQMLKKYTKGKYFIRIQVEWDNQAKYNTGVLAIFASKLVKLIEIQPDQAQKYWISMLKNYAIKKGPVSSSNKLNYIMVWMRAQMICFSYLKQTETGEQMQSKWIFEPNTFENCTLGYNCSGGKQVVYKIGKGQKNGNLATLKRLVISKGCRSGSVQIAAIPL